MIMLAGQAAKMMVKGIAYAILLTIFLIPGIIWAASLFDASAGLLNIISVPVLVAITGIGAAAVFGYAVGVVEMNPASPYGTIATGFVMMASTLAIGSVFPATGEFWLLTFIVQAAALGFLAPGVTRWIR